MISGAEALRLQAWVDGELTSREAREVAAWVEREPEARAFADDLCTLTKVVRIAEPAPVLTESREFYWSGIEKGIASEQARAGRASPARGGVHTLAGSLWWRWLVPTGAVAAVALSLALLRLLPQSPEETADARTPDADRPIPGVNAFTFRSESEQMTVVWVDFESN